MANEDEKILKAARALALSGDPDGAAAALAPLAAAGSGAAAASLAELLAFRGDWAGVVANARLLLESPGSFYAADVFDDMVRLLGVAGHELRDWTGVAAAARSALGKWEAKRNRKILEELSAYAARGGAPPHERIEVFGVAGAAPDPVAYAKAMQEHEAQRGKKKPEAWARHAFALANVFQQHDELARIFLEHGAILDLDNAIDAARVLARRGDPERAWRAIEPKLDGFWPVDRAQVAPVVLITDEALRKLGTPERWARVLRTARGPAAKASAKTPAAASAPPPSPPTTAKAGKPKAEKAKAAKPTVTKPKVTKPKAAKATPRPKADVKAGSSARRRT